MSFRGAPLLKTIHQIKESNDKYKYRSRAQYLFSHDGNWYIFIWYFVTPLENSKRGCATPAKILVGYPLQPPLGSFHPNTPPPFQIRPWIKRTKLLKFKAKRTLNRPENYPINCNKMTIEDLARIGTRKLNFSSEFLLILIKRESERERERERVR